ncbi:hypothetical protein HG536_0C01160 [Torulaspora globosa]|uniref:Nuclear mRNA export factor n=1 Tax=Torulaspora globosa TaxID=48254 RepID=A0A7G3ZEL3_9SACH|nr:uncharacterized protein HG536_0C01160 [Torulaspora globosa]QLL31949.1 hypothetical protein HG536_0C01160 [Torulaspora globosa]
MNTSFGTAATAPNFSFFQNNVGPTTAGMELGNNGGRQVVESEPKWSANGLQRKKKDMSLQRRADTRSSYIHDHLDVGPLARDPQNMGFERIHHAPREIPKFLIGQQPQLKQKEFVQDPWDRANQQKMLELEASIEDVDQLYNALKKMRDVERKVMEKKGLVDKADLAKDLTEAIAFQGTCQDMCPTFERARRNVEHTVYSYEKDAPDDKKASRFKALKVFARPAAAAAPPLPSDVRPPHVLSQTLDYLVDNLLVTLPSSEEFLWDRMRSIRQDFTYQNYSGPEAVYCNERIVRIHLLIIHVMGRSKVDFSLQQELEQLHKALITLAEIYDEVRAMGGTCPNEAEFRAYALLSKIRDPEYDKNIQELPQEIFQNELVQMAICFRRIVSSSNFNERGYIKTENCLNFYKRFFQLLVSGAVPFLMSSFMELYVNEVRFYAFKALSHSLNKRHKAINPDHLIDDFLFNDYKELESFCEYYSITLTSDGVDLKSLPYQSHKLAERQPLKHAILKCVDKMLDRTSYPALIKADPKNTRTGNYIQVTHHQGARPAHAIVTEDDVKSATPTLQNAIVSSGSGFHKTAVPQLKTETTFWQSVNKADHASNETLPSKLGANKIMQPDHLNDKLTETIERKATRELEQKEEEERLAIQKKRRRKAVSWDVAEGLVKDVVNNQISRLIEETLQKHTARDSYIKKLAKSLYHAFLHEKLYQVFLESKADAFRHQKLVLNSWSRWNSKFKSLLAKRKLEAKKKSELQDVGRLLGVPGLKRSKLAATPRSDSMFAFTLPSSSSKNLTLSPIVDEVNKFSVQHEKKKEVWEPFDMAKIYLDILAQRSKPPDSVSAADIFIYGNNWSAISNSWIMAKFNVSDRKVPVTVHSSRLDMKIHCIDANYNPALFNNVQLLVFNTGVTDSNIFDLEMKLRQDGEELIKLITGISLNTNICFSIMLLYWESAETPLHDSTIYKCLRINRILKGYNSVIQDVKIVNITGSAPEKELENALKQMAERFQFRLTDRGKYHVSLLKRRSLAGVPNQKAPPEPSNDIDRKMRKMLEQEQDKRKEDPDARNTYAHLRSHLAASPRMNKRKLPVLLSKSKERPFRTPLATRSLSSSSPAVASHLAIKVRGEPRRHQSVAPGTPSYCTNLSHLPVVSNSSLLAQHPDSAAMSNTSLDGPALIREPALFRTPVNSTTTNQMNSNDSMALDRAVPESVLELKALIESVKRKVNNH